MILSPLPGPEEVGLFISDVSGHGTGTVAQRVPSCSPLIFWTIHRRWAGSMIPCFQDKQQFVTAFYGICNLEQGDALLQCRAQYALSYCEKSVFHLGRPGLPLAIFTMRIFRAGPGIPGRTDVCRSILTSFCIRTV